MTILIEDTTIYETSDLGAVKPLIQIGGSNPSKFIPNINISNLITGNKDIITETRQ